MSVPVAASRHTLPTGSQLTIPAFLLDAQRRALEMIINEAPLAETLTFLTRIVEDHADGEVVASILLLDSEGRLYTGAAPSLPENYNAAIDGLEARVGFGTCSEAAVTQRVVITRDLASDPNWEPIRHLPLDLGLRAAWSQPILNGFGKTLGTFGTYFRETRDPSFIELQLVSVLARTAAIAIERKVADEQRDQQQRILHCGLEAAEMGTWRYNFVDNICECSPRAQELYGLLSARWKHDEEGVKPVLHPDDIPLMWDRVKRACDPGGNGRYSIEYRVRQRDGSWRWMSVWGVTEFQVLGGIKRAVALTGATRDITDLKEAEARQKLLVNELNHRVKNTLAIVQAIATQTIKEYPTLSEFKQQFFARISALSKTHSLLSEEMWQHATIDRIVDAVLDPFRIEGRITVAGEALPLEANRAVALCLLLHELATNALKYGSLATDSGELDLTWSIDDSGSDKLIRLNWHETGVHTPTKPGNRGFGSRLIDACASQLGGNIQADFTENGVAYALAFPVQRIPA